MYFSESNGIAKNHRMAITRSALGPKKIKFDDDDDNIELETKHEQPQQVEESEEEDSGSDSDDAPEEESISTAKKDLEEKKKLEQQLQREAKQAMREKRKQQDQRNREQQDAKRAKEEAARAAEETAKEDLPDLLPEGLAESLAEDKPAAKHIKVKELDAISAKLLRQKQKEEKLRKIKASRLTSVNKGPINVQVQSFNVNKKVVPRSESAIVDSKNQWLQRLSLNKK